LSSETIARRFNISMKVVNSNRRKLGVSLSWQEARALSNTEEKRQRVAEAKRKHLNERWAKYRAKKIETLLEFQQRLERRNYRAPIRTCRACGVPLVCTPPILSCTTARVAESRQGVDVTDLQDLQNETQTGSETRSIRDSGNWLTTGEAKSDPLILNKLKLLIN